jgi:hypothetical protein
MDGNENEKSENNETRTDNNKNIEISGSSIIEDGHNQENVISKLLMH